MLIAFIVFVGPFIMLLFDIFDKSPPLSGGGCTIGEMLTPDTPDDPFDGFNAR